MQKSYPILSQGLPHELYNYHYVITTGYHMIPHVLLRKRKKTDSMTQNRLTYFIKLYHKNYQMQKSYPILSQGLPHELCDYQRWYHTWYHTFFREKERKQSLWPKIAKRTWSNFTTKVTTCKKVTLSYRKGYHTNYIITIGYHMIPHVLSRKRKKTRVYDTKSLNQLDQTLP